MFFRKGILKICSKFTGEHPCRSVISIKLQREHKRSTGKTADELLGCVWQFCGVGDLKVNIVPLSLFLFSILKMLIWTLVILIGKTFNASYLNVSCSCKWSKVTGSMVFWNYDQRYSYIRFPICNLQFPIPLTGIASNCRRPGSSGVNLDTYYVWYPHAIHF